MHNVTVAFAVLLVMLLSYFFGCFNGSFMVSHFIIRDDVRKHGSGNAGLTNAYRTVGAKKTLFVLLGDIAKGAAAVSVGWALGGPVGKLTAGIFVILGHMFPLYFGFKGGKGVLVGAVMLAFFDWRVFAIAFALFILSVVLTKWISLGSILGAVSFPLTTWLFYRDPVLTAMAFGMAAAVVFMHRSNIGRILHGTENKFSFKSKKTIEASPDGEEK